jgi:two-component system response regulator RegA
MSDQNMPRVLIIDDDERFRKRLCRSFDLRGWEAFGAADGAAARTLVVEVAPDLALVDLKLASESGLDVVGQLRDLDGAVSIIMLTGYGGLATAVEAIKCGADRYLTKPVDGEQILSAFETLRDRARTNAASRDSPYPCPSRMGTHSTGIGGLRH